MLKLTKTNRFDWAFAFKKRTSGKLRWLIVCGTMQEMDAYRKAVELARDRFTANYKYYGTSKHFIYEWISS